MVLHDKPPAKEVFFLCPANMKYITCLYVVHEYYQILHARRKNGLTQAELAEKIEVSLKTVIDIEKGKRNPTFDVLYRLIIALDIPAELIFRRGYDRQSGIGAVYL